MNKTTGKRCCCTRTDPHHANCLHLLVLLREKKVMSNVIHPETREYEHLKANLILEHKNEFPLSIRRVIDREAYRPPRVFLAEIHRSIKTLVFGFGGPVGSEEYTASTPTRPDGNVCYGLDSAVDTEDQLEVAIRMFPWILHEKGVFLRGPGQHYSYAMIAILSSLKSFAFLPLVAELEAELESECSGGGYGLEANSTNHCHIQNKCNKVRARGRYNYKIKSILFELLRGFQILRPPSESEDQHDQRVDTISLEVLSRLKSKGLMKRETIYEFDLVWMVLLERNLATEKRLRFLLDWDPSILKEDGRGCRLLYHFLILQNIQDVHSNRNNAKKSALDRFRMLFELGMKHHPMDLGFLFHKEGSSGLNSSFRVACNLFGMEAVMKIINGELCKYSFLSGSDNEGTPLQTRLVMSAATNDEILLEGIYHLYRRAPILS